MTDRKKPVVLLILDGWGYSETEQHNAIHAANKPNWDKLWQEHPHTLIRASESAVGLPANQMGNSEVGHLNLGAGRVVHQEISRIDHALDSGFFFDNAVLTQSVDAAIESNKAVHIMGLLSDGGVHSHNNHIHAMVKLAADRGATKILVHAFLDGRDTPPKSAEKYIKQLNHCLEEFDAARIASVVGRYFAMDRDTRWNRVKSSYDVMTHGNAEFHAESALKALENAYMRGEKDEFVQATAIHADNESPAKMNDGDTLIFMNFRSDRARQITQPFIEPEFAEFDCGDKPKLGSFVSLTEYKSTFDVQIAFPPVRLNNVFGSYIADLGLRQLRIAETEKYAHVTFFLNGGIEEPFPGEDRILVPSPDVATYDLQPEMNAPELTEKLLGAIESEKYDVIICNYANPDMVGHTGNFDATVQAIEALDICVGQVVEAIQAVNGEVIITADHGNAEQMMDVTTDQAHTAHTVNPVPFIYIGRDAELAPTGALSDVTPTMLYLMDIEKPDEMGGQSLVKLI